ncbi:MAG TPA: hypothetical protein VGR08_05930 [Thermomicrobiales bacterium]|nr:hypothetical protein [Thermomicrobiales bacterium]
MVDTPASEETRTIGVSEQELAVLGRIAGLSIAPARLPAMARDLSLTLQLAGELDAVLGDEVVPVIRPFDPSWPDEGGNGR